MIGESNDMLETQKICKKCGKKLPSKSYFCMYCGTDNAPTSIQTEFVKTNNEILKKYSTIEAKKYSMLWYILFLLLIIDIIAINTIFIFNQDDLYIKMNNARFENYDKAFYLGNEAYLAVKDNKAKIIGDKRIDYLDVTGEIQKYDIADIQEVNDYSGGRIYILTTNGRLIEISGTKYTTEKIGKEYQSVYHYLNKDKNSCTSEQEYTILDSNVYYYDQLKSEVYYIESRNYDFVNGNSCNNFKRKTVLSSDEINMNEPILVHQSQNGRIIVLKDDSQVLKIEQGNITERIEEFDIAGKKVKVKDIKQLFYDSNKFLIIDKKNSIYNYSSIKEESNTLQITKDELNINMDKVLTKESKTNLIILIIILLVDIFVLYKMSDKSTFKKCLSLSGILMVEIILFTVFRGSGYNLESAKQFFTFVKMLISQYLLLLIVSIAIVQISDLVNKILKLISFKNIFSYILTFTALLSTFLNVLGSGNYGVFFAIFILGSYWTYYTETEDIDINLFIRPSSKVTIIFLSIVNIMLFILLLNLFQICNYFLSLLLITFMYSIYLAARPEITKKELTGKSIKSLIIVIISMLYSFVSTLLLMNLFTTLQKDDGTIMKSVLSIGFKYILYLVVTFVFLILICSIFRILHKIIIKLTSKINTVVVVLIFNIIVMIAFSLIIYFFPEIINLINSGVSEIFKTLIK